MKLKLFIASIALSVGSLGGVGVYEVLSHQHSTGGSGYGAVYKGFEKPKYSTKGSGFHYGVNSTPQNYHHYWTGGKKYIQRDK